MLQVACESTNKVQSLIVFVGERKFPPKHKVSLNFVDIVTFLGETCSLNFLRTVYANSSPSFPSCLMLTI